MPAETVTVITPAPSHVFVMAFPASVYPLMEPGFHTFFVSIIAFMALSDVSALIILGRALKVGDTARALVGAGSLIASTSILVVAAELYAHTVHVVTDQVMVDPLPRWLVVPIYATVLGTVVSAVGMFLYLWRTKVGRASVVRV